MRYDTNILPTNQVSERHRHTPEHKCVHKKHAHDMFNQVTKFYYTIINGGDDGISMMVNIWVEFIDADERMHW